MCVIHLEVMCVYWYPFVGMCLCMCACACVIVNVGSLVCDFKCVVIKCEYL